MKSTNLEDIRNIGIISHIDAGKTTVSERILFYSGETHKMGEVHDGLAVMDWMPQEQERGITITATSTICPWKDSTINLVDTPGHIDFTIEVERSMRVLDGAIAIFSAVDGVQPQSESVWRQANRYQVPRICFINKMDRTGADYLKTVNEIATKLKGRPVLLQLPIGHEGGFSGVIDLISEQILVFSEADQGKTIEKQPIPPHLKSDVIRARKTLVEVAADFDDSILLDYLSDRYIDGPRIVAALRKGSIKCQLFPILIGSALRNKGIQPLLDAVVNFLPSPSETQTDAMTCDDIPVKQTVKCDPKAPLVALAFKVLSEDGNKLTYLRIYAGSVKSGMVVSNSSRKCRERIGRLFLMHAHKKEQLEEASAGNIVAVTGLKETLTGDTLCDQTNHLILQGISTPDPVVSLAVEAKGVEDRERLIPALEKLQWEDPTFLVREDKETGQTILTGMGELHLEIIIDRLHREYGVSVITGAPQVVLRETINNTVERTERFQHEIDGKVQYGEVKLRLTPLPRGKGVSIKLPPEGEQIFPPEYIQVIHDSILQATNAGCRTGYPLTDLEIQILDVPFIQGLTTGLGLKIASQRCVINGCSEALVLLEPVMSLEIIIPSAYAGKVLGAIQQKQGQVQGINTHDDEETIIAFIPLGGTFGYMTELRSTTKGRGTYTMEFSHFDLASQEIRHRFNLT